jgi:hypothetical protein
MGGAEAQPASSPMTVNGIARRPNRANMRFAGRVEGARKPIGENIMDRSP